jgi:AraC family transcriptional regulator
MGPANVIARAQADGSDPELLASASGPGAAGVSVSKLRFVGGARMQGEFADPRISFNLTGSATKACNWKSSTRARCHFSLRGSLYVCPPRSDCTIETDADIDVLSLSVPAETLGAAVGDLSRPGAHLIERAGAEDRSLLGLGLALAREAEQGHPNGAWYWSTLSDEVVLCLIRRHLSEDYKPIGGVLSEKALRRVNAYIAASMSEAINLDRLADAACQSRFHFQRTFAQTLGITPYRYVMRLRLKRAVELIQNERLSLAVVAAETGFVDQSHLSRWGRKIYGMRLTEFRDRGPVASSDERLPRREDLVPGR